MGRKRSPGLILRGKVWYIDKRIGGRRVFQSTGTDKLIEAEIFLARVMEQTRKATLYGVRPSRTFEQAAAKFVLENQHKRSLQSDIGRLKQLMPFIGTVALDKLHRGSLEPWIAHKRKQGAATGTINHGRRILNLAASEWVDEYGLSWLATAPKIKLLPDTNKRQPAELGRAGPAFFQTVASSGEHGAVCREHRMPRR